MGSLRFEGVRFRFYSDDHPPPHVHCFYGEYEIILEFSRGGVFQLSRRSDAVTPRNTPRTAIRRALRVANLNADALLSAWESLRGFRR